MDRPGLDNQGRTPLIKIRRVRKGDLAKVRDVIEQAFGDFFERQMGTRPRQVFGGAQYVHHRWLMEPWGCFVAEEGDGKIVGAALAVIWGTIGLVGPLAVLTNYQNQDIGQQLLTACQGFFSENKATLEGVSTYPYSPKHITLYQKFGYKPKGLVVIAAKPMDRREIVQATRPPRPGLAVRRYSSLEEARNLARHGPGQGSRDRRRPRPRRHPAAGEGARRHRLRHRPHARRQRGPARQRLHQVSRGGFAARVGPGRACAPGGEVSRSARPG